MPKIEPAIQTFSFSADPALGAYQYIDIMQVASLMNRRAYRQGQNVAIGGFTLLTTTPQNVLIEKLPNTWVVSASWEKSFRAWKRQQDEALEDGTQQSVRARFNDFKVYFDEAHAVVGNLLPAATNLPPPGTGTLAEWDYSEIVIPNYGAPGTNYIPRLHMLGPDAGGFTPLTKGIIEGYAASRSVPQSPDPEVPPSVTSGDNWLNLMFDVGDNNTEVLTNAIENNNDLPYDQINYPGETFFETEIVDFMSVTGTTVGGMTRGRGSTFPCGLIKLNLSEATAPFVLLVHMIPGPARGYMCQSMVEM
jgi:hypothetical protein